MTRQTTVPALLLSLLVTGCGASEQSTAQEPATTPVLPAQSAAPESSTAPAAGAPAAAVVAAPAADLPVQVALTVERRTRDAATEDFVETVRAVLQDSRGWARAGFAFRFDPQAAYRVVLAEGAEVDRLCAAYNTAGRFSCQNGPVVAVNADRWRTATSSWPGALADYRTMLVNHEVGHLLGQHHPGQFCARPGQPAAVMAQQSKGLRGCTATSWPLAWEVECARRHDEPLAPPYEATIEPTCGPDG